MTIIELRSKKKKLLKDSDNERWTFVRFNGLSITPKYIIRMIPIIERQVYDSFVFWDMHVADVFHNFPNADVCDDVFNVFFLVENNL